MSDSAAPASVPTAAARRLKYGLNVAVAVIAAVAVVAVVNVLAYKFFLFKGVTALGQYSLSKQTRQILRGLEKEYTLATLMTPPDPVADPMRAAAIQQTIDLVDVYGRQSPRITVEHYNTARDITKLQQFFGKLEARFSDRLAPQKQAIERGRAAMANLHAEVARQVELLKVMLADEAFTDPKLREFSTLVLQMLAQFDQRYAPIEDSLDKLMGDGLPDYTTVRETTQARLTEMRDKLYTQAITQFEGAAKSDRVPPSTRDMMLQANVLFNRSLEAIKDGLAALDEASPVAEYDALRSKFADTSSQDMVVVVGGDRVQVVPLSELSPDVSLLATRESPELRFLGEERITGALISMGLAQPPLVVFVSSGPQPALGPQGMFEHVARRLRSVNFDVQMWNPAGQMAAFGQMTPPGPPPTPQPGQKAVWIVCPFGPDNPMNPMAGAAKDQTAQHLQARIDAGDTALFMFNVNFGMRFGASDPIAEMLGPWGITPQLDRIILRELVLPDRQARPTTQFQISQWPTDLPVTTALEGMQGVFLQASPLLLGSGELEGVTRYPLVKLEGQRMWAEEELQGDKPPTFKAASAASSFLVAAAAEAGEKRIVVFTDPAWASNDVTTMSRARMSGEDAVSLFGAAFPANAELFVNSVFWLAGLEDLIAASPRSQDIRRIEPMSPATHTTLRWVLLVGIPAAAFLAGIGMWLVRRRA